MRRRRMARLSLESGGLREGLGGLGMERIGELVGQLVPITARIAFPVCTALTVFMKEEGLGWRNMTPTGILSSAGFLI